MEETPHSLALRSPWARPFDWKIIGASVPVIAIIWWFYPYSLRVLGLAGPPIFSLGLIALAISIVRVLGRTELFISDLGLNLEHRFARFFRVKTEHVPRRRARQAFVKTGVFQQKTKNWSLHLLLDDGSTRLLLDGITDRELADRLETKIEKLFSIDNRHVVGEVGETTPFSGDLLPYPKSPAEADMLPDTARFSVKKLGENHFYISEKWWSLARLPNLAALAVLVLCSIYLNGANWFFWLLTAFPLFQAAKKIKSRFYFELRAGILRVRGDALPIDFQPKRLSQVYVAPADQRGQVVTDYQLVLLNHAGDRCSICRNLSLEEAFFLQKKLATIIGLAPSDPAEILYKKIAGA